MEPIVSHVAVLLVFTLGIFRALLLGWARSKARNGWGNALAATLSLCAVVMSPSIAAAGGLAMVADDAGDRVIVFDADSDTVLGTVDVGVGTVGDCSISDGQDLGFVTAFDSSVWVIDLQASPPVLASGTNPIPISNTGVDTALTPDGRFLLVCGTGLHGGTVSVVDVAARTEVDSFDPGHGCSTVEVCDDGSVLIAFQDITNNVRIVRRLTIDIAGNLSDTGATFFPDFPGNLACAPGAATAVVFELGGDAQSFTVPGLTSVDSVNIFPGFAVGGQVGPRGDRLYAQGSDGSTGIVKAYDYNSVVGTIGDVSLFEIPVSGTSGGTGLDRLALHPSGSKLYVSEPGAVDVYDAFTGGFLTSITDPDIVSPTGLCFSSKIFVDGFESGNTLAWSNQQP